MSEFQKPTSESLESAQERLGRVFEFADTLRRTRPADNYYIARDFIAKQPPEIGGEMVGITDSKVGSIGLSADVIVAYAGLPGIQTIEDEKRERKLIADRVLSKLASSYCSYVLLNTGQRVKETLVDSDMHYFGELPLYQHYTKELADGRTLDLQMARLKHAGKVQISAIIGSVTAGGAIYHAIEMYAIGNRPFAISNSFKETLPTSFNDFADLVATANTRATVLDDLAKLLFDEPVLKEYELFERLDALAGEPEDTSLLDTVVADIMLYRQNRDSTLAVPTENDTPTSEDDISRLYKMVQSFIV